jgi:hypothetical protein
MTRRIVFVLGFLLGTAAGCTSSSVDGPINYQVLGGLTGHGDGTWLQIEPDGTMMRNTPSGAMQTATLDRATLDDLHGKILDAQFPNLSPTYSCNCADDFSNNVSVGIDGRTHTVAADTMATIPAPLETVIVTLKAIYQRPL